jgi:hypothetical protein
MWCIWFIVALLAHLGISILFAWCSRTHTAYCTVPKPEAFKNARSLAEASRKQGYSFKPSDFIVFHSTTIERWASRPWVAIYFFAGLLVLLGILVIHVIHPGVI